MQRLYEPSAYDTDAPINSWWRASGVKPANFPTLETDITTEIAIIGGGYTGLNAALQLAEKHSRECVVLEAGQPGWGASGRNGGFACLGGAAMSIDEQIKKFGLTATKKYMTAQVHAVDLVRDNLNWYEIAADTHSKGELVLAHHPRKLPKLVQHAAFQSEYFGLDHEIFNKEELEDHGVNGPEFHGGVLTKTGFALNPLKYVIGLAGAVKKAGISIFANSAAHEIRKTGAGFTILTGKAVVHAKKIIFATNGYSSEDIPVELSGRFLPLLSTIMVTRPISREEQNAQGWTSDLMSYDSRHLLHYFRLMPDGCFLFGQRGAVRSEERATIAAQNKNRRDFERMFPAWKHVETTHKWSGLLCLTLNQHQFVGPLDDLPGTYASLGYHGNGVAMASLCGRYVADFAVGKTPQLPPIMTQPLKRFPFPAFRRSLIRAAYLQYSVHDKWF